MDYLRKVFNKKQIFWLILTAVALVIFLIVLFTGKRMANSQPAQLGAKRWDSSGGSALVSVFFSDLADFNEDGVKQLNFSIDNALQLESLNSTDSSKRTRISAYSGQTMLTVTSATASQSVKAIGVGGDFFRFHPVNLISGSYFDGDDVMQDQVILDKTTAWYLYGSADVAGQMVEINGVRHLIAGVYEMETGRLSELAGNNEQTIYLSYESLYKNAGVTQISCFETIMPEPVHGFAYKTVCEAISLEENRYMVVDNSARFYWETLIKQVPKLSQRSMNSKSVIYPYWENMARGLEGQLIPLCVIDVSLFAFIVINLVVLLIRLWTNRQIHTKQIKDFVEDRIDDRRKKKRESKKLDGGEYIL